MGKAGQKSETSKQAPTRKTKSAVDRRKNNQMLRQCPSGIAQRPPHHAIAVPTGMQNRVTMTRSTSSWPWPYCFTSTEARLLIRDGDRGARGRKSEGSTADIARKRTERPWTAARTMEVLRRCPLAIAQRLVHCAIAVSTAVLGSHKDNVRCTAVDEQPEAKEVQLHSPAPPPCPWSLLG